MMVVLPEPLGPRKPKSSPLSIEADVVDCGEVAEADGEVVGLVMTVRSPLQPYRCGHAGFEGAVGVVDVDFVPKTWCWRSSRVWTLRGRNSA